jgi:hypothetical protein
MLQLRLTQHAVGEDRHRVEISLEGDGARRTAEATFSFRLSPQDEEGMRWYLEDFLQYPQAPAPMIARRPEVRGLSQEEGIVLLDRAAEMGLLTSHGGGYYGIHPALPWFFKGLFERCYRSEGLAAVRAFVAMSSLPSGLRRQIFSTLASWRGSTVGGIR